MRAGSMVTTIGGCSIVPACAAMCCGNSGSTAISRDCTTWHKIELPIRSRDVAIGIVGDNLLLATSDADHSRLWLR